ncbi:MAG: hypothetical protein HYZ28_23385 [Myxococcales bacterium]|nr:hypothetical protein [Myxococcales bacterium]
MAAIVLALGASACGPPPAQVAGTYSGQQNLIVTGGAGEAGSEVISVTQQGGEIKFTLGLCQVKAVADTTASFRVEGFRCTKYLASQAWELIGDDGKSKVSANSSNLSVAISGRAKSNQVEYPFSWGFNGARGF